MKSRLLIALFLLGIVGLARADGRGCCAIPGKDFPKVGGNLGNWNYSSLSQITRTNVKALGGAWHLHLEGGSKDFEQQASVIAVGGVIYVETSQGNVFAVDGATGRIVWEYKTNFGPLLHRGVAVGGGRVYATFAQNYVGALDQKTGKPIWLKQIVDDGGPGRVQGSFKSAVVYYDGMIYFGSADAGRGVAHALDAATGDVVWRFYGTPGPGEFGNDTWEGDSWKRGGASPWMHPAIDPELGLVYWTFGNARNAQSMAVDGSMRGGQNLFANSIVAINAKTGKRVWHFQSVHHDIWDMDGVMAPVLADIPVRGQTRKIIIYGSKTGMYYVFDRATGKPITPIVETPVPQQPLQKTWPTQPIPEGDALLPLCINDRDGPTQVPPNYQYGCLFTPHLDFPVVQSPGTGGGMDWSAIAFNPRTNLIYVGIELVNVAHIQHDTGLGVSVSTGFRPLGEKRSGKIVAFNPATHKIAWQRDNVWGLSHGNGMLATAGGVMFIGQQDGTLLALDEADGKELWRFQTGAGVHSSPATYEINGEQYIAVLAGGSRVPYNSPQGDDLWGFKLGGTVPPAPAPSPPSDRQPITAPPVEGALVNNTVSIARMWSNNQVGASESGQQNAMAPQSLAVPAGTTVIFTNPAGNSQPHCVTQFYEGLFASPPLKPGESFRYTFNKPGEYYYNDCTSPPTTGRVIVYSGPPHAATPSSFAPTAGLRPESPAGAPTKGARTELPPGSGRDYVQKTCSQCHDIARVAGQRHSHDEWGQIIDQMRANGLVLDAAQRKTIQDYLTTALGQ
ncbi:MAG TPA: PQQ-binding-like beta-propeller repeat protein [Rhizomicrobium sp.]|nr:PQQ-binding-like beta-propeller repeat protein [Rhizomicrobium sp.]